MFAFRGKAIAHRGRSREKLSTARREEMEFLFSSLQTNIFFYFLHLNERIVFAPGFDLIP